MFPRNKKSSSNLENKSKDKLDIVSVEFDPEELEQENVPKIVPQIQVKTSVR